MEYFSYLYDVHTKQGQWEAATYRWGRSSFFREWVLFLDPWDSMASVGAVNCKFFLCLLLWLWNFLPPSQGWFSIHNFTSSSTLCTFLITLFNSFDLCSFSLCFHISVEKCFLFKIYIRGVLISFKAKNQAEILLNLNFFIC